MTPILVEPLSEQAYELLRQLEALHILRVVPATEPAAAPAAALSPRKWAGALSDAAAASLHAHVEQVRSEWERP